MANDQQQTHAIVLSDEQWRLIDEALENASDDQHTHAVIFAVGVKWGAQKIREAAAKACDAEQVAPTGEETDTSYNMACGHCADAIRALPTEASVA